MDELITRADFETFVSQEVAIDVAATKLLDALERMPVSLRSELDEHWDDLLA